MYTLTGPLQKKRKQERKERARANQQAVVGAQGVVYVQWDSQEDMKTP